MKTLGEIKLAFKTAKVTGETILSNDIKKGDFILENIGWYGEIVDNKKGNIRLANIYGYFEEIGSIYIWDISWVIKDGKRYRIELTEKQNKDMEKIQALGF